MTSYDFEFDKDKPIASGTIPRAADPWTTSDPPNSIGVTPTNEKPAAGPPVTENKQPYIAVILQPQTPEEAEFAKLCREAFEGFRARNEALDALVRLVHTVRKAH